ncbi:serine--tRNA ligase [Mesoterricola silvestris]|uniref:Serine--tRNA ligase n=1 Tax=Mesoterricola silvestris TaxID=2927979 RepID=A0AA48GHP2_9BACT|nr:serine--tRNA ligase [Mesoterricola silvestris]BDU71427.1 serine--tRNA ligase [Mesoterricola silvestris]
MLDFQEIRRDPERFRLGLQARQEDPTVVDNLLSLDERMRSRLRQLEALREQRNLASRKIPQMQDPGQRQALVASMREVGGKIGELERALAEVEGPFQALLEALPNLPDPRTPLGEGEQGNLLLRTFGTTSVFPFPARPHWELGPDLGILDFERGVKLAGSRFYVLSGAGARLQRALIAWMIDLHIRQGYQEKYLPFLVKPAVVHGAGQLPKFAANLYQDAEDSLYLVPTAEVPLTGLHLNEILEEAELPRCYTAYTPCFRREKMSAGRDVRGIKRGHQFDKVEMYIHCRPEDADSMLDKLLADAEATCTGLGLPYRVKQLCTGDLGFAATRTYDLEVWAPGCGEWLEVSSVSSVGSFQARRSNLRYRPAGGGKPTFLNTLNGSGLGLPRTLIAVMENYQQADGSIRVPEVLRPWMGGMEVIEPEAPLG